MGSVFSRRVSLSVANLISVHESAFGTAEFYMVDLPITHGISFPIFFPIFNLKISDLRAADHHHPADGIQNFFGFPYNHMSSPLTLATRVRGRQHDSAFD